MITKLRAKKRIPEMMPTKKWLSLNEACAYMDMSVNHFQKLAISNSLTVSFIGSKKYYRVEQLENLIEQNILIKKPTVAAVS